MLIRPIPLREDNYGYLIIDEAFPKKGALVDPFTLSKCQEAAKSSGVEEVVANITTHHHQDHAGGNGDFAKAYPKAPIYGGSDQVEKVNKIVGKGDSFPLFEGSSINVKTYPTPCHTQDSTAFFLEDSKAKSTNVDQQQYQRAVFTGDTLFISGCGRFFEGTAEEMDTALNKTLASLPGDTVVMCGHEYTKSNVAFSQGVLPSRPAIQKLVEFVRNNKVTTGKFTIDDEKKHNIFMLVNDEEVKKALNLQGKGSTEVMATLRELKNSGKMMSKV
ncbi:Metallo-hydrolase/oxidoreductase [Meira miltonrushii]|uniref:hydroxyacylglutathione hydrolase n=1 Tax=Meira miltonrushii TaxID=1280837 RepID=A0A316V4Z2_9BASI|nr:Metallo-hydrolase/oxidoreductase [Meira miltonrushii]PWN32522.1 Metallo-hydrolase/oxidoreductase [Meira miltonrushii]